MKELPFRELVLFNFKDFVSSQSNEGFFDYICEGLKKDNNSVAFWRLKFNKL